MSKNLIAPSILSSDFSDLTKDISLINNSTADYLHVDVMDGRFVPNISFGQNIVKTMHRLSTKPLDVHLMIVEPEKYIQEFRDAGASIITVHYEACTHLHRTIQQIKSTGAKAGVALNPHTPADVVKEIIKEADLILVMSVNPGFGGQSFIENSLSKVARIKEMIIESGSNAMIEIDGGVGLKNAQAIKEAGCDILVAGNAVFSSKDPADTIKQLKFLGN
jgi:ribulose-phosphate 3-epimerase